MDKPITFNEWLGTQGNMVLLHANCCRIAFEGGQQSMQAKVGEMQKQLNEYIFVAETIDEMYVKEVQKSDELQKELQSAKESAYKAGFYDGRNGTPCEYVRLEAERNELQTLYTQQGINMLKLQKRVEELESLLEKIHRYGLDAYSVSTCMTIRDGLEQALKGEGQ